MKEKFFDYSKNRGILINVLCCIFCFLGLFLVPAFFDSILSKIISNETVVSLLSSFLFIITMFIVYYKDLIKEAKTYTSNFKECFKKSFKYYIIGFLCMVFFNLINVVLLKNISMNETQVRDMLFSNVAISLISISIIAPISEELIFRKSLQPLIKNKWIYVIVCGLLFGGAHILTNITNNVFVITDLFYILPYASLGCSFALMDYETKTTFSSIVIHALHNTFTALLLLLTYFGGNLG